MRVTSARTILHADLDAFFASVEQRDDAAPARPAGASSAAVSCWRRATRPRRSASGPRWVAGRPAGCARTRSSCRRGMSAYAEASKAVFEVFDDTTPLVEGISIDEAFLDVGGLWRVAGTPVEIAARLRARVRERVGLPITVGVARTKFLAKVASGVAKPDGLLHRAARRRAGLPASAARRAAVGSRRGDRGQAARARRFTRRRRRCAGGPRSGVDPGTGASGATCTRSRTTATRGRVQVGRRRRSIGGQRALGRAALAGRARRHVARRWSTGCAGACAPPGGRAAPSSCGCASTTSPAPPVRTPLPRPTARHSGGPRRRPCAARRGDADDPSARDSPSSASRSPTSTMTTPMQLELPFPGHLRVGLDGTARRHSGPLRHGRHRAWRAARP